MVSVAWDTEAWTNVAPAAVARLGPQPMACVASRKRFLMSQVPLSKNQEGVLRSKIHPGAARVPTTVPSPKAIHQ